MPPVSAATAIRTGHVGREQVLVEAKRRSRSRVESLGLVIATDSCPERFPSRVEPRGDHVVGAELPVAGFPAGRSNPGCRPAARSRTSGRSGMVRRMARGAVWPRSGSRDRRDGDRGKQDVTHGGLRRWWRRISAARHGIHAKPAADAARARSRPAWHRSPAAGPPGGPRRAVGSGIAAAPLRVPGAGCAS